MNSLFFEHRSGLNPFPGRRDLDQNPLARHALGFVLSDQLAPFGDRRLGIEGKARVDFGRYPSGDDFENLESPDIDDELTDSLLSSIEDEEDNFNEENTDI